MPLDKWLLPVSSLPMFKRLRPDNKQDPLRHQIDEKADSVTINKNNPSVMRKSHTYKLYDKVLSYFDSISPVYLPGYQKRSWYTNITERINKSRYTPEEEQKILDQTKKKKQEVDAARARISKQARANYGRALDSIDYIKNRPHSD
jgi:hypothetical protein